MTIESVKVNSSPGSFPDGAEGDLPQAADFPQDIGNAVGGNAKYGIVCVLEQPIFGTKPLDFSANAFKLSILRQTRCRILLT